MSLNYVRFSKEQINKAIEYYLNKRVFQVPVSVKETKSVNQHISGGVQTFEIEIQFEPLNTDGFDEGLYKFEVDPLSVIPEDEVVK